jgi:hypothetical protein
LVPDALDYVLRELSTGEIYIRVKGVTWSVPIFTLRGEVVELRERLLDLSEDLLDGAVSFGAQPHDTIFAVVEVFEFPQGEVKTLEGFYGSTLEVY